MDYQKVKCLYQELDRRKKYLITKLQNEIATLEWQWFQREISDKEFIINLSQDANSFKISKMIEIIYGIRNFIGNANKFAKKKIYVSVKSNNESTEISIEDDGNGYPKDILGKIGEPYIKSSSNKDNNKSGLGLGIFIGKTLLERNKAKVICRNSKTRLGAEVIISWKNTFLKNI